MQQDTLGCLETTEVSRTFSCECHGHDSTTSFCIRTMLQWLMAAYLRRFAFPSPTLTCVQDVPRQMQDCYVSHSLVGRRLYVTEASTRAFPVHTCPRTTRIRLKRPDRRQLFPGTDRLSTKHLGARLSRSGRVILCTHPASLSQLLTVHSAYVRRSVHLPALPTLKGHSTPQAYGSFQRKAPISPGRIFLQRRRV